MPPISPDDRGLSSEEIAAFRRFVSQLDHTFTLPTSSFAHSGTATFALYVSITNPQFSRITDSGTSHHMTNMSSLFTSYHIYYGKDKFRIADGSLSSIAGHGDMCLFFILHVPTITLNLLSISHITKNLNCCITFFSYPLYFRTRRRRKRLVQHMRRMVFTFRTLIHQ